eukprot:CAMPEP_0198257416 /NCGR_PEP_ID=MMETSP1447-20131203/7116_1 /TAXON_ID=420782 /ORGANISM="Chaetoceros dichaeta, Strain CCMP1751" /LENGTH=109 /DNA_ID=CAMNT_0043944327 /DNA_START=713 /DNA_END=1042 /DNA_ORIENTATION=+
MIIQDDDHDPTDDTNDCIHHDPTNHHHRPRRRRRYRLPLCIAAAQSFQWYEPKQQLLQKILKANMAAIEVTDSSSGLEPFMLAAVGLESDLEAVFRLLVEYPVAATVCC